MIVEQAFFALPEFLVGSGFVTYESEGTLVMAYAMAMLQELNGRGVNNPIAQIRGEVAYPDTGRSADIHVNYAKIGVLSPALQKYGVRSDNWLEAKFFRKNEKGDPTLSDLVASYAVLRDLLRLAVLVPEATSGVAQAARYFLHVYEGSHEDHLTFGTNVREEKRANPEQKRTKKAWLEHLYEAGTRTISETNLDLEPATFDGEVGASLRLTKFSANFTTISLAPVAAKYHLYLTRLDDFAVVLGAEEIKVASGTVTESSAGAWSRLRAAMDKGLKKDPK